MKKNNFNIALNDLSQSLIRLKSQEKIIYKSAEIINKTFKNNKVIFCGNGGSAADSSHAVAEFVGRFFKKKRKALNAISLNENNSSLTAIANDFDYKYVFSRQLEGVGKKGDLLFAISTSGKSKNILEVIKKAKKIKMKTILLTGQNNINNRICNVCIKVPAKRVDRIQELHILVLHILAEYVDQRS
jgi:D-sedoheptulose 7-phosphate isomerase